MIRPPGAPDGAPGPDERAGTAGEDDRAAAALPEEHAEPAPPTPMLEEGAPIGPSEGEEAAFLAEQRDLGGGGAVQRPRTPAAGALDDEPTAPLPPLEDLVNRIPGPTRALLDELFRAKFVTVKRVPKSALK